LGKTTTTLTAINRLIYDHLDISKVLVIAPRRVAESVWAQEVEKWEHLKHLKVSKVIGDAKKRKAALAVKADIYTIGRDNVAWLCGLYGGGMLPFDMLVIDESSSFKNHASMRFKALKRVQPSFSRVVLLTGTPAPNSLIDLWAQIWLLDRGKRLGESITFYRDNYFRKKYSGHGYEIQKDDEDPTRNADKRIHNKIKDICISMKAEDYLDLPERITNFISIDFPPEVKKRYEIFERDMVLEMFEGVEEITAMNAAGLSNKLLQFAGGAVYDAEKNWHEVHDLKLDAAEDIIESANGQPVLIAYTYKHELERLLVRLKKYKPVKLTTDADILKWNKGEIQVLLAHPASAGHGLNLQAGGSIVLWFSLNWSLELYQGQKSTGVINHLIAQGTEDETVVRTLDGKRDTHELLMQAVKAKIAKHLK
jgi:SNF2 family DNA or RNA helicase